MKGGIIIHAFTKTAIGIQINSTGGQYIGVDVRYDIIREE